MTDLLPQLLVFSSISVTLLLSLPAARYHVRKLYDEAVTNRQVSVGDYAGLYFYITSTKILPFLGMGYLFVMCLSLLVPFPVWDFSYLADYVYYAVLALTMIFLIVLVIVGVFGVSRGLAHSTVEHDQVDTLLGSKSDKPPAKGHDRSKQATPRSKRS